MEQVASQLEIAIMHQPTLARMYVSSQMYVQTLIQHFLANLQDLIRTSDCATNISLIAMFYTGKSYS